MLLSPVFMARYKKPPMLIAAPTKKPRLERKNGMLSEVRYWFKRSEYSSNTTTTHTEGAK